jgi:hypothetical protein
MIVEAAGRIPVRSDSGFLRLEVGSMRVTASLLREEGRWVMDEDSGLPAVVTQGFVLEEPGGEALDSYEQRMVVGEHLGSALRE